MRSYIQTAGLIIKVLPRGEKDRSIELLSPLFGKIHAVAKGARNLCSPFVGRLQPLNLCSILLYQGKERFTIIECMVQKTFRNIEKNLKKITYALEILESLRMLKEMEGQEKMFELACESLEKLEKEKKSSLVVQTFRIKFLDELGLLPALTHCAQCHAKIKFVKANWWNPPEIYCQKCTTEKKRTQFYEDVYRKLIQYLKTQPLSEILKKIKLTAVEEKILQEITEHFWNATEEDYFLNQSSLFTDRTLVANSRRFISRSN